MGSTLYQNSKNYPFSSKNTFYGRKNTPCTAYIRNGLRGGVEFRRKARQEVEEFEVDQREMTAREPQVVANAKTTNYHILAD
jgi:hypothetical protein